MELLPDFAPGSSSSSSNNLRVPANSVDFRGMADAWSQRVPELCSSRQQRSSGQQCSPHANASTAGTLH
jgi:hypothetical protein